MSEHDGIVPSERPVGTMGNQWTNDPRQMDFLRFYMDPKSITFNNALQSALKAGYTQEYSESITVQHTQWFEEALGRRKRLLNKAEMRLEESLDWEEKHLVLDSAKHITKTLGREAYAERTEAQHIVKTEASDIDLDAIALEVLEKLKQKKLNEVKE